MTHTTPAEIYIIQNMTVDMRLISLELNQIQTPNRERNNCSQNACLFVCLATENGSIKLRYNRKSEAATENTKDHKI